jgi:hypothetical protein
MFCVVGRSQLHHRLCFGIYDANCDGPSYENPVKIVKAAWCRAGWWIFSTFFLKDSKKSSNSDMIRISHNNSRRLLHHHHHDYDYY